MTLDVSSLSHFFKKEYYSLKQTVKESINITENSDTQSTDIFGATCDAIVKLSNAVTQLISTLETCLLSLQSQIKLEKETNSLFHTALQDVGNDDKITFSTVKSSVVKKLTADLSKLKTIQTVNLSGLVKLKTATANHKTKYQAMVS